MNNKKRIGFCMITLVLFILFSSMVIPFGITPGKQIIDFQPKLRKEVQITLVNDEDKSMRAALLVRGELAKYMELSQNSIEVHANQGEKSFTVDLLLPAQFEKPGLHEGQIVVREIPQEGEGVMNINTLVEIITKIQVRVPYPGKYAEAAFEVVPHLPGEQTSFHLRIQNLGEEDIESAKAFIYVYDKDNTQVAALPTSEKKLLKGSRDELTAKWKTDVPLGNYRATAILDYDGVIQPYETTFTIGNFFLKPIDLSVQNFRLGSIAKFSLLVDNLANEDVEDAVAEIVLTQNDNEVARFASTPTLIEAKERGELILYWDTKDVEEGIYEGYLTLSYKGKSQQQEVRMKVSKDRIETELVGITGFVTGSAIAPEIETPGFFNNDIIMGMLIMLVIIMASAIIMLVIMVLRKRH